MQLVRFAREHRASTALIESYAYRKSTAAHTLGELGGVVRLELVRAGLEVRTVQMSTARKLLLGKVPRTDPGIACYAALRAAGARFETADAAGFTVLNNELAERPGFFFARWSRQNLASPSGERGAKPGGDFHHLGGDRW